MSTDLDGLRQLIPPPADGARPGVDWSAVTAQLGTELPSDYIELIETYGGGRFEHYLWLLEPFSANEFYDLVRSAGERAEAFEMLWSSGEEKPSFLDAPAQRLLPWASTDNGEFAYWLVSPGVPPDRWPVVVNEARGEDWARYDLGCVAFLLATLRRTVVCDIFWDDYPADPHSFEPIASFG
jgi:hypothetical protein